jgi:hypothetical protein
MSTTPNQPSEVKPPTETPAASQGRPAVDLRALAEKIYALLKEELRLERDRLGRR